VENGGDFSSATERILVQSATMIIDFHAHAFEDALADKAISRLEEAGGITAFLDGRIGSLRTLMQQNGIRRSVLCPIATKPKQFDGIRRWARLVRDTHPEFELLLSIHPDDPDALAHIDDVAEEGFKGVKFHPYYQQFTIDERRLYPLYERLTERELMGVFHCGFDIAFPRERIVDPQRIRRVADDLPNFRLIATHFGGWEDWQESLRHLIGRPIYIETSMTLSYASPETIREMVANHPTDHLLFGTDSPWGDAEDELARWRAMDLPPTVLEQILGGNAERLLGPAPGAV
jgi:predicted TIM-barrel fold metal-dependent hydrolase